MFLLNQSTGTSFDGSTSVFLVEQKNRKFDHKMRKKPQKVQKYWKSKNGVKTALTSLFKELWAILEKLGL